MTALLEGVKVVELGTHVAVPRTTRMLADWGAEVIKIEPPRGEAWRVIGNIYQVEATDEFNPMFQVENQNKKSLCLNLKTEEGKEILFKLLEDADVFITNTRPNALKKMGLDYDQLKDKFPQLIYAFFGAYGSKGPKKDRPGFDIAAYWASGGTVLDWSVEEDIQPMTPIAGFGDATCSAALAAGILASLYSKQKTGKGDYIETSLYQMGLWYNSTGIISGQTDRIIPRSFYEPSLPLINLYKMKDGECFIISEARFEDHANEYFDLFGLPQYKDDPRYTTTKGVYKNMKDLVNICVEGFANVDSQDFMAYADSRDLIYEKVAHPKELFESEQALVNDYIVEYTERNGEKIMLTNNPIKFSDMEQKRELSPLLGENTVEILEGIGYTDEQIQDVLGKGAAVQKAL